MPIFSPDNLLYGDGIGWGIWLDGHFREHEQFVNIGFTSNPVVIIPPYDFTQWSWTDKLQRQDWLDVHNNVHNILRNATGVQGEDLADADLDDRDYFALWVDTHAQEHAAIRRALGITT